MNEWNMHKEICESPRVIENLVSNYFIDGKFNFSNEMMNALKNSDDIIFVACGTSYHASHIGVHMFRKLGKMSDAYLASEWAYNPVIYGKKPLFVLVSQSGETADILACKDVLKGRDVISITNCRGSSVDKMAKWNLPLDCGEEKAIAATKSYVAQVVVISMLANALENNENALKDYEALKSSIELTIKNENKCEEISKIFVKAKDAFFLGREIDYYAALEASLKLKETCYIHSEAYAGGELKHGPVALIENGVPFVGFISSPKTAQLFRKNLNDIEGNKGTKIIISSESLAQEGDSFITKDVAYYLEPVAKVVVFQLIAFHTSKNKGFNVDNPRNLVKAVIVE